MKRITALIAVLALVGVGLAGCEPKPPKPRVDFSSTERSLS